MERLQQMGKGLRAQDARLSQQVYTLLVRKQFVEEGIEAVLQPKPSTRVYEKKMDGRTEAHLIAVACGAPPKGRARWTLRLLGDQMVILGHVDALSHETVRRTLKKTNSSRG